jgi:hypothetical protein
VYSAGYGPEAADHTYTVALSSSRLGDLNACGSVKGVPIDVQP